MAEYVRFVSYLYEYQGNAKKKNVGFVRYEVRAGQKRLTVAVNGARYPDGRIPVYAFYREMDSCIGVALGTLVLKGGRGSFQYSTYADGPGDGEPECRFEEIAGVVVMGEAKTPVFCTVWDNEDFLVSAFVRSRQELVRVQEESEAAVQTEQQEEPAAAESSEDSAAEEPKTEIAAEEAEDPGQSVGLQECQECRKEESEQPAPGYALYRQSLWERLCKLYPKVRPFPYNVQIGALRIRPGDLGRLPKENWSLANNSFMLHGFFQYRYILLLHLPAETSEYEERYMIGVPGVYSQTDQYLAELFGFQEFLGSPRQGQGDGSFGYFLQEVQME